MNALEITKRDTVGLLELFWHWVKRFAPAGDVGKWDDAAIAAGVEWTSAPSALIGALRRCRWVDANEGCRLIVHDWPQHADDTVHSMLARAGLRFADGTMPKMSRLSKRERDAVSVRYESKTRAHGKRTQSARNAPHGADQGAVERGEAPKSDSLAWPGQASSSLSLSSETPKTLQPQQEPLGAPASSDLSTVEAKSTNGAAALELSGGTKDAVRELVDAYHERCPRFHRVKVIDPVRRQKATAALRRNTFAYWLEVYERAAQSSFLCGESKRGWRPDFEWFFGKNENGAWNAVRVLEGAHDDPPTRNGTLSSSMANLRSVVADYRSEGKL